MKISTKGRYAIRSMLALASSGGSGSIKMISKEEDVSAKYLEAIFSYLTKQGLVKGKRGPSGGYALSRPASAISAYDILIAMGDELTLMDCLKSNGKRCTRKENCPTRPLWHELDDVITSFLKGVTLADLLNRSKKEA